MIIVSVQGEANLTPLTGDQRIESLNELFKSLYDELEIVQEVYIDGVNRSESYNDYLIENINNIQSIEIKTVNEVILLNEIRYELKSYLPKLIQACDSISELFYGEMKQEQWNYFGELTNGIQWVEQSAHAMLNHTKRFDIRQPIQSVLNRFIELLEEQITELQVSLENNDYTAVGDIIKYEMPDTFQPLLDQLEAEVFS